MTSSCQSVDHYGNIDGSVPQKFPTVVDERPRRSWWPEVYFGGLSTFLLLDASPMFQKLFLALCLNFLLGARDGNSGKFSQTPSPRLPARPFRVGIVQIDQKLQVFPRDFTVLPLFLFVCCCFETRKQSLNIFAIKRTSVILT